MATSRARPTLGRPWTVAFYSYRGGVGRTTLAVSAARELNAFILDLDLEAPGVDEFESMKPASAHQPGLVEFLESYVQTGRVPNVPDFVYTPQADIPEPTTPVSHDELKEALERAGFPPTIIGTPIEYTPPPPLRIMRAGRKDDQYRKFLSGLDWPRLYREYDGYLFFENLRAGVQLEFGNDLMIVDSRTGLTHLGGICLGHLADAAVLVFEPTLAHIDGMVAAVRGIKTRERLEGRPIPRLYIANKIPRIYEGRLHPEMLQVCHDLVQKCEGEAATIRLLPNVDPREWDPPEDGDFCGALKGVSACLMHIECRPTDSNAHLPDSRLLDLRTFPDWFKNHLPVPGAEELNVLCQWIERARQFCEPQLLASW